VRVLDTAVALLDHVPTSQRTPAQILDDPRMDGGYLDMRSITGVSAVAASVWIELINDRQARQSAQYATYNSPSRTICRHTERQSAGHPTTCETRSPTPATADRRGDEGQARNDLWEAAGLMSTELQMIKKRSILAALVVRSPSPSRRARR